MIFVIFILSGLMIDNRQIMAGFKDIAATAMALGVILVVAPLVSLLILLLPVEPGTAVGMFIVAVMPTTLSSGIVMTRTAGGNMAHALFITISANFISIFTIPVVLPWLLSFLDLDRELVIDQAGILWKLIVLVLIPLALGMITKGTALADRQLPELKMQLANQWMIIAIVFVSLAGSKTTLLENRLAFFYILIIVGVFHVILLLACFVLIRLCRVKKGRYESIMFMGAQKTLALSAMIQVTYFSEFGTALLVCVMHHIVHLMIDSYLSSKMQQGWPHKKP